MGNFLICIGIVFVVSSILIISEWLEKELNK